MPVVPENAPKRFYPISALTGFDAFVAAVMPRGFLLRWLAAKILRAAGTVPVKTSIYRIIYNPRPENLPTNRDDALGFAYQGEVLIIANTAGKVARPE